MDRKQTFEPVQPLPFMDGTELHSSMRTSMRTNVDQCGRQAVTVENSRLQMSVESGQLKIRFAQTRLNRPSRLPMARERRARYGR